MNILTFRVLAVLLVFAFSFVVGMKSAHKEVSFVLDVFLSVLSVSIVCFILSKMELFKRDVGERPIYIMGFLFVIGTIIGRFV